MESGNDPYNEESLKRVNAEVERLRVFNHELIDDNNELKRKIEKAVEINKKQAEEMANATQKIIQDSHNDRQKIITEAAALNHSLQEELSGIKANSFDLLSRFMEENAQLRRKIASTSLPFGK